MSPLANPIPTEELDAPRRIKISSKRQITIPASTYEKYGFAEYAPTWKKRRRGCSFHL